MAHSKGKHIDFIVTTSDPNDASSTAENKKRVRSVAALKSWPDRRRKFFDQLEPTGACQTTFLIQKVDPSPAPAPVRSRKRKAPSPEDSSVTIQEEHLCNLGRHHASETQNSQRNERESVYSWTLPHRNPSEYSGDEVGNSIRLKRRRLIGARSTDVALLIGEAPLPTPPCSPAASPSNGRTDPFNCYPVQYRPWFDRILHHMLTVYAPRGWPSLKITNQEGLKWERFMTQNALAEPALFYVRLYFGSGDMASLGIIRPEIMGQLRLKSIKAINAALSDPQRATSDALILAVGRIALSECLYGDKFAASAIHRPAQKRMIDLRGGIKVLGFPDLILRLMRWSDRVMAMQTNTPRLLEDDVENKNFTLEQSVTVLEKWSPSEGRSLRKKIENPRSENNNT